MLVFGLATKFWESNAFVLLILLWFNTATQIIFVGIIAGFMMICWNQVAATQFSIYMSLSNLGRSVGAAFYGMIAADLTSVESVFLIAGFYVLAALLLTAFDINKHKEHMSKLEGAET